MASCHADDFGGAKCVKAVDEGDADLDFSGFALGVSCGDVFTEGLQTPHLGINPAARMVSGQMVPEIFAVMPGGAQGLVSRDCGRAVLFPRAPVLSDRNDCPGVAVNDGGVAAARIVGAIRSHLADLFGFGDLVQQLL